MIIQPALPGGYVTFVDDIREEVNGKLTLVGRYSTQLNVRGEPPFLLPQLSAMIVYREKPEDLPQDVTLKILRIGTETEVLWESMLPIPAPPKKQLRGLKSSDPDARSFMEIMAAAHFAPFGITEDCVLAARAYRGDDEIRLGSLMIKIEKPVAEGVPA